MAPAIGALALWGVNTHSEVLPETLELTTDPIVVGLLPPPLLELGEGLLQNRVRPDLFWFRFLRVREIREGPFVPTCTLAEVKRR